MKKLSLALAGFGLVVGLSACAAESSRVLVVGEGFGEGGRTALAAFRKQAKSAVEFVACGKSAWRRTADGGRFDSVVVPMDDPQLLAEIRAALPNALYYVEQPWTSGDLADYDRVSLACSRYSIAHRLETIPTGFAVAAYRGEMEREEFTEDLVDGMGTLNARGECLRAAVWVSKFTGTDLKRVACDIPGVATDEEQAFMRRCAQEAVNIYTPVPVRNCALEAIGRMTPVPVEQDWWKKRLADKKKEIAALKGAVDLVFVGSSQIHIWETRCPVQMKDLERDFTVLNLGYSGDSFQKVYWRLTKGGEMDGYRAKCIMMVQGGNNTSETPTAIALGMKMLLDAFKVKQPQAKVVLHPVNPRREWDPACPATTPRPRPEADVANAILKRFADANDQVIWCDFREEYYDDNDDTLWCMPGDRLHAGTEGLKIWYSHIAPIFREVCGKPLPPVTPGTMADASARRFYKPGRKFIWEAKLGNRGGFTLEKREGADGRIELKDGRLMIHKTNDRGYLMVKAHPFAAYQHVPMRLYADVEVADAAPRRSFAFLRVYGRKEDLSVQAAHRKVEPVESWEAATGLEIRPAGAVTRKYIHFNSPDGDNQPVIIVAGMPSKTYWTNWRAEETNDRYGKAWRKNELPSGTKPLMPTTSDGTPDVAVVLDDSLAGTRDALTEQQLGLFDVSGVPYAQLTVSEVLKDPKALEKKKAVVLMGVRSLAGEKAKLVELMDKPGRVIAYIGGTGAESGLPETSGYRLDFSADAKSHETQTTSVRWSDLTPGGYLGALVESYDFGAAPAPLTVYRGPRATLADPDEKTQVLAKFTEDGKPAITVRRNAKGCLHVFIGTAAGFSPDYFNRLMREQGAYVAIDESGVEVKVRDGRYCLRAERSGRYDLRKRNGEKVTVNMLAGEVVEL